MTEEAPAPLASTGPAAPAVAEPLLSGLPPLVAKALRARTPSAEAHLERDPWAVLLAADLVTVDQADRYAESRGLTLGGAPQEARRSVALVRWLLDQEAGRGHTWIAAAPLLESLEARAVADPREAVELAISEGAMIATEHRGGPVAAPAEVGAAEESLAEELARLAAGAGVLVLTGPARATDGPLEELLSGRGSRQGHDDDRRRTDPVEGDRTLVLDAAAGRGRLDLLDVSTRVVVRSAQRLGLLRMSSLLARVPDEAELVLVGDPADQLPGAGDPLGDLARLRGVSGLRRRDCALTAPSGLSALDRLRVAVRDGQLPPLADDDRSVVVVPVADEEALEVRLRQLLTVSLPERLSITPQEVVVVAVGDREFAERLAHELARRRVAPREVVHVREQLPPADAVVVVVPPAGLPWLDRRVLVAASARAGRQLSVINGVGDAFPTTVAAPPLPRRTRLPDLLLDALRWQREL